MARAATLDPVSGLYQFSGTGATAFDSLLLNANATIAGRQIQAVRHAIASRHHDRIAAVTSTIAAALAAISDNGPYRRYLLYVPNGTYDEEALQAKAYVDLVGESRTGVILSKTSVVDDTIKIGGINAMIANMTIRHTCASQTYRYPIHADGNSDGTTPTLPASATMIVYNCAVEALGSSAKSGIGIGLRGGQRIYLVDSDFSTANTDSPTSVAGIYAHNQASDAGIPGPSAVYVLNCRVTGTRYGLHYANARGLNPYNGGNDGDRLVIIGGSLDGGSGTGHYDLLVDNMNDGVYLGAGEVWVYLDPLTQLVRNTSSLIDASKQLAGLPLLDVPVPSVPQYEEHRGPLIGYDQSITLGYSFVYPPTTTDDTYVKATTQLNSSYAAYLAAKPAAVVTGDAGDHSWLASANTNQRYHIDLGSAKIVKRLMVSNMHNSGSNTDRGIQHFTLWGSNSATAFAELTYATDTDWTQLTLPTNPCTVTQHPATDTASWETIAVTNTTAYRYYAMKCVDGYGASWIGCRGIQLYIADIPAPLKSIDTNARKLYLADGTTASFDWNQQPVLATGASHTVDEVITALQTLKLVKQS
jgi:hypothetical protein